ncbi:hypothetical protein D1872_329730 [compost metagenome]
MKGETSRRELLPDLTKMPGAYVAARLGHIADLGRVVPVELRGQPVDGGEYADRAKRDRRDHRDEKKHPGVLFQPVR